MLSYNGIKLRNKQRIIVSDVQVKKLQLPTNKGIIVDAKYNLEQLVSVKLDCWQQPVDFHAKSLSNEIIEGKPVYDQS